MIEEVKALIDEYVSWLHDQTALREVGEVVEITTPYLDRNNDHVQIYVKKEGDIYIVGDDGYTFADLELSGCELDTPKRKQLLELTLNVLVYGLEQTVIKQITHETSHEVANRWKGVVKP